MPCDLIRKFFSYQPLQKWYKTMDGLMEQLTLKRSIGDEHFGDKIVVIREFLIRLAYALYYIYEHGGITIPLPPYVHMESRKPREEAESNNESLDDPHDIRDEEKMSEINSTKLETENKAQI